MNFLFVRDYNRSDPAPFDKLFKCYADYSPQCSSDMPYICSSGLLKGSCTSDPNVWQRSRMCNRFCDVRNKPSYQLYPSHMPVPDRSKKLAHCPKKLQKTCPTGMPYRCINGIENSGCTSSKQYFQNSASCNIYCDTRISK